MNTYPSYQEAFVSDAKDPLIILNQLVEKRLVSDYLLYESDGDTRIVGNPLAKVDVQDDVVRFNFAGTTIEEQAHDPLKQTERFFHTLPLEQWVSYGYVGFDVCKYYSKYSKAITTPILSMIVPELELRFTPEGVYLKTLHQRSELLEVLETQRNLSEYKVHMAMVDFADKQDYLHRVETLVSKINQGALHKAILSRSVKVFNQLDPILTYAEGTRVNNSVRSYCLNFHDTKVVGFSPEILMTVDQERFVVTNPLAGTRPRGETKEDDQQLMHELFTDAKEVKEHALSIHLAQDEIQSVCMPETVHISNFMEIKKYRSVQHLSSRVGGILRSDKTSWDALKVLFPGITVSGIDKKSALEWIDKLEDEPRGIYSGAVGWIDSEGTADLAIAIRSVFQYEDVISFVAGAGIMGESDPEKEYQESVNKMNTMLPTLVLEES